MTEIILHGDLGKKFGKKHKFSNIKKAIDAVKAVDCIKEGFKVHIMNQASDGVFYEISVDGEKQEKSGEVFKNKKINKIEIAPMVAGRRNYAGNTFLSSLALNSAIALHGISKLATVDEEFAGTATLEMGGKSFSMMSPGNATRQGDVVPIGYGYLRVGSKVVGVSQKNYDSTFGAQFDPEINYGSDDENVINFAYGQNYDDAATDYTREEDSGGGGY